MSEMAKYAEYNARKEEETMEKAIKELMEGLPKYPSVAEKCALLVNVPPLLCLATRFPVGTVIMSRHTVDYLCPADDRQWGANLIRTNLPASLAEIKWREMTQENKQDLFRALVTALLSTAVTEDTVKEMSSAPGLLLAILTWIEDTSDAQKRDAEKRALAIIKNKAHKLVDWAREAGKNTTKLAPVLEFIEETSQSGDPQELRRLATIMKQPQQQQSGGKGKGRGSVAAVAEAQWPEVAPGQCRNCRQFGHIAPECSQPKKCYKCQSTQHLFRKCPQKARAPRPPAPAPADSLYVISRRVEKRKEKALTRFDRSLVKGRIL